MLYFGKKKLFIFFLAIITGIIFSLSVTSQASAATVWTNPQLVSQDSFLGNIAVGPNGTVHAVFQQPGQAAYYSSKPALSNTWSTPFNMSTAETGRVQSPLIAVGGDNVIHVVWYSQEDGIIKYTFKKPNTDWQTPVPLLSIESISYDLTARAGIVHFVWSSSDGEIFYSSHASQLLANPGDWSTPVNISQTPEGSVKPRIAIGANGSVHVVWGETFGGEAYYASRTPAGVWSTPELIPNIDSQSGEIAVDGSNIPHVVGNHANMLGYTKKTGGSWTTVTDIVDVGECGPGEGKQIVVTPNNTPHVTWMQNNTECGLGLLNYSRLSPTGWTSPVTISDALVVTNPHSLAVGPLGALHLLFDSYNDPFGSLYYVAGLPL